MTYFQHGRRHHPKGTDPIEGAGIVNHWIEAETLFTIATDAGAPVSPSFIDIDCGVANLSKTSDLDNEVYTFRNSTVDYIAVLEPGGYMAIVIVSMPEGMTGYMSVDASIAGDAWLGVADNPRLITSSTGGVGGGVMARRQPFAVLDSAIPGSGTEVGVHGRVWQSSGISRSGIVTVRIERLT